MQMQVRNIVACCWRYAEIWFSPYFSSPWWISSSSGLRPATYFGMALLAWSLPPISAMKFSRVGTARNATFTTCRRRARGMIDKTMEIRCTAPQAQIVTHLSDYHAMKLGEGRLVGLRRHFCESAGRLEDNQVEELDDEFHCSL